MEGFLPNFFLHKTLPLKSFPNFLPSFLKASKPSLKIFNPPIP